MPNNVNSFNNVIAPGAAGSIYTVPANTKTVIQKVTATSQEASNTRLLTIYSVPPAGAPGATNILVDQLPIPPLGITDIPQLVNLVLPAGYQLYALIDSGITVYLNGSVLETS